MGDRDFVQQPPLIPHTTAGYQITKNFNKCMDCHAFGKKPRPAAPPRSASRTSATREGTELDNISRAAISARSATSHKPTPNPLVENTFPLRART